MSRLKYQMSRGFIEIGLEHGARVVAQMVKMDHGLIPMSHMVPLYGGDF